MRLVAFVVALTAALAACGESSSSGGEEPLAVYPVDDDTAFMDALIGGVVEIDGPCFYVVAPRDPGARTLIAFPEGAVTWDGDTRAAILRGKPLVHGSPVSVGGALSPSRDFEGWPAPPHDDCETERVWLASDVPALN